MSEQNQTGQPPVDQHILYLINSSIDGEISASEQDELGGLLITSPDVRSLNDELRAVARVLGEVPEVDPPEYLQDSIERQVRLPVRGRTGSKRPGLWGVGWLRTGLAMAAAVVLTFGVYEMGSEPITAQDSRRMAGTMAKSGSADQPGILLDSIQLNTAKLSGMVELRDKDEFFMLDLQLISDEPTEVVIDFAGRGLEIDGVSGKSVGYDTVSVVDGSIHLASKGEEHFTVRLRHTSAVKQVEPLDLSFFANSELIQQAELIISKQ